MSTPSDRGLPVDASAPPSRHRSKPEFGRRSWRRFFTVKRVVLVLLGLFVACVALVGVAFARTAIPQPNELANAQASVIYYADGKTEMARISTINRQSVPLSQIPLHVQHALLAAEDRTFYQNNGVSPTGIARALIVALKGGPTQGGSTITQQYVKNYFLTQDKTISRKAKEFIISIKIDQSETKDQILANYLNTIYYGRGAYGIETAAKAYFGVDASQLTVAEGALLASVIRGPGYYDPALGPSEKANAIGRVKYVLDGMVTEGWLTPQARAKATFPNTIPRAKVVKAGTLGYITNEVRLELTNKLGLSTTAQDRGGLRIVTTIDKKAQDSAVSAVNQNMPSEYLTVGANDKNALHVGLTAVRPGDGAIVAMYGGRDYSVRQWNSATDATAQGGSTFKVFGLLAALQKEISTKTRFYGYSPQYFPQFADTTKDPKTGLEKNPRGRVSNFGNEQEPNIDLRRALQDSVNTVFAQLNIKLSAPGTSATGVRDAAILAGLPKACATPAPGKPATTRGCTPGLKADITNIFGTASPRVLDMANAYATIAAQGQRATPYLIASVTTANGSISYKAKKVLKAAFTPAVTADVTDAMTQVVKYGTGSKANALGRPAAGKTGTTSFNKAVWFDGFTPQLSAAVAIFQGDGTGQINVAGDFGEVTGGTFPTEIWAAFMQGALQGTPVLDFPPRVGVGDLALPPIPVPPTVRPTATPSTTSAPVPTTATPTRTPRPTPTATPRPTQSHPTATSPSPTPTKTKP